MSLYLPKNKKQTLFAIALGIIFAIVLLAIEPLLGSVPKAYAFSNIEVQTIPGNESIIIDSQPWQTFSQSNTRNLAQRWRPTKDTRVCSVAFQIEAWRGPFSPPPFGSVGVRISSGGFEPNFGVPNSNHRPVDFAGFLSPIPPSQSFNHPWSEFNLSTCKIFKADVDYWFEIALNQGGPSSGSYVIYGSSNTRSDITRFSERNISPGPNQIYNCGIPYPNDFGCWVQSSTSVLNFRLLNDLTSGSTPFPETPSSPNPDDYDFTNRDFGLVGNFFRDVLVWLFYPDANNLSRFSDLFDKVKNKPPLGYFTAVKEALSNFQVGTPNITLNDSGITSLTNPIKTGVNIILYVMLAFWIFRRFSHLSL